MYRYIFDKLDDVFTENCPELWHFDAELSKMAFLIYREVKSKD